MSILTGDDKPSSARILRAIQDTRPGMRRDEKLPPLDAQQSRKIREAMQQQRAEADMVLGALDLAEVRDREAAEARAELARLRASTPALGTPPALGPAPDPGAIGLEYSRTENGLLRRVSLKAAGYRPTHVDVYRDAAGRMRELRVADE